LLCCFGSSKKKFNPLLGASNSTKIVQIDEGFSKIHLLQVKGVMGMMWVGTYDQFAVWSLRSLDATLLSLHFKNIL
jgi:hypothetical protein